MPKTTRFRLLKRCFLDGVRFQEFWWRRAKISPKTPVLTYGPERTETPLDAQRAPLHVQKVSSTYRLRPWTSRGPLGRTGRPPAPPDVQRASWTYRRPHWTCRGPPFLDVQRAPLDVQRTIFLDVQRAPLDVQRPIRAILGANINKNKIKTPSIIRQRNHKKQKKNSEIVINP